MSANFDKNHFQLFDLPESFSVDRALLAERQRLLQQQVHPDKFAASDERQQRLAMQMAAQVNQAYEVLSSPLKRADYLLQLRGVDTNFDANTHRDMDFLMQQMALREAMDEIKGQDDPEVGLEALQNEVAALDSDLQQQFAAAFAAADYARAESALAKLHFSQKLGAELYQLEGELLDY